MSATQKISSLDKLRNGLYWGTVSALSAGSAAYLQNRFNVAELFKRIDPSYVAPPFKTALILGTPAFAIEYAAYPIEVLTAPEVPEACQNNRMNRPLFPSYARKAVVHNVLITAVKTFLFIKGAETLVSRGFSIHRGFLYQAALIYAMNAYSPEAMGLDVPMKGILSMACGAVGVAQLAVAVAQLWVLQKIGMQRFCERFFLNDRTPPFFQVFTWISTATFVASCFETVTDDIFTAGFGLNPTESKIYRIAKAIIIGLALKRVAERLNFYGFSVSEG